MEDVRKNLVALAAAYSKATGLAPTTIGAKFHGNRQFFLDLERRKISVTLSKADEIVDKFRACWPAGTPWPEMRTVSMARRKKSEDAADAR